MSISVIIPTYNESDTLVETVEKVRQHSAGGVQEIIVADGGSTDATVRLAREEGCRAVRCPRQGRAQQMNYGAARARGEVLYFLHADTHPPPRFDVAIHHALAGGCEAGCFRLSFDDTHPLLKIYGWFTRFNIDWVRFGDQSLFITKDIFLELDGFREDHRVMEDQEMVRRIKRFFSFKVLDQAVKTSARKYKQNGLFKLQLVYFLIFSLYYMGMKQEKLVKVYGRLIK